MEGVAGSPERVILSFGSQSNVHVTWSAVADEVISQLTGAPGPNSMSHVHTNVLALLGSGRESFSTPTRRSVFVPSDVIATSTPLEGSEETHSLSA